MKFYWYARAAFVSAIAFLIMFLFGFFHFLTLSMFDFAVYTATFALFWLMIHMDEVCTKKEQENREKTEKRT